MKNRPFPSLIFSLPFYSSFLPSPPKLAPAEKKETKTKHRGSPRPLCKDSPEDPCCTNTYTQSSLPPPPLLLLNNEKNNYNHENFDLSLSPSSQQEQQEQQQQQQQSFLPQDPSFTFSSEFLPPTDISSTEVIGEGKWSAYDGAV